MRTFLGLPINQQKMSKLVIEIQENNPQLIQSGIRWLPLANYHLTLHFLGHITEEIIEKLSIEIEKKLNFPPFFQSPFTLEINKIDFFPARHHPRMIAAYLNLNKNLAILFNQLGSAIIAAGLEVEDRPLLPHITLARFRQVHHLNFTPVLLEHYQIAEINQAILYQSKQSEQGSVYIPLRSYDLKFL